jgi:hypothetical protein
METYRSINLSLNLNHIHGDVYSIQHYLIMFVSGLRQVYDFFSPGTLVSSTNKTDHHWNIVDSGVKYHKPNLSINGY